MRFTGAALAFILVCAACGSTESTDDSSAGSDEGVVATTAVSGDDALALSAGGGDASAATTEATPTTAPTTTAAPTTTTTTIPQPLVPDFAFFFLPAALPESFLENVSALDGMRRVSIVSSGTMHVEASLAADGSVIKEETPGFVVPVEGNLADPQAHPPFLTPVVAELVEELDPDEVILGKTSAEFRQVAVGDRLRFENGSEKTVIGVVEDNLFGSTEILAADPELFISRGRVRQVAYFDFDGTLSRLERGLRTVVGEDASFRLGRAGPAPVIQTSRPADEEDPADNGSAGSDGEASDADDPADPDDAAGEDDTAGEDDDLPDVARVLSQLEIKKMFGEFAYKPGSGDFFEVEQAWRDEFVQPSWVPILGMVRCHKFVAELLVEVMNELIADGLDDLIDPDAYKGCWSPRYIAGSSRLSHHAWGIAADINFFNPLDNSPGSPVNKELLRRMNDAGFTSGHLFTNTDPGHFEFFGPQ